MKFPRGFCAVAMSAKEVYCAEKIAIERVKQIICNVDDYQFPIFIACKEIKERRIKYEKIVDGGFYDNGHPR